jgi:hypothetical protein
VRDDSNVADVSKRRSAGHGKFPLKNQRVGSGFARSRGVFRAANGREKRRGLLGRVG